MAEFRIPDVSSGEIITLPQLEAEAVRDTVERNPRSGIGLRMLYQMVRAGGEALCYRGWAGQDLPGAKFVYYESAVLPFGRGARVDHILVISMLVLRSDSRPGAADSFRM
jgi:hypothetical protein